MEKNNRLLSDLTVEEFRILIQDSISDCISRYTNSQGSSLGELMKMKEVADHFKVTLPTIHKWRRLKILPPAIKKGGRVFFLRKQILEFSNR